MAAMIKLVEEVIGGLGEQFAPGGKEVAVVLDFPQALVHWNPVRGEDAGVLGFVVGEVFFGETCLAISFGPLQVFLSKMRKVGDCVYFLVVPEAMRF